jgi:hypothetical protein
LSSCSLAFPPGNDTAKRPWTALPFGFANLQNHKPRSFCSL